MALDSVRLRGMSPSERTTVLARLASLLLRRSWGVIRFSAVGSSGRLSGVIGTPAVEQIRRRTGQLNHKSSQFAAACRLSGQPASSGRQVRRGIRQSIPSSSETGRITP
jgi:hypothetical protein